MKTEDTDSKNLNLKQNFNNLFLNGARREKIFFTEGFHLGYELKVYRQQELINFIRRDIVGYCLTDIEYTKYMDNAESEDFIQKAWLRISKAPASKKGDWGEFILYAILKYKYNISDRLAKVKIKTSRGDQVKGFDCAHFKLDKENKLTLFLGESKFYKDFSNALSRAIKSVHELTNINKVKDEVSLLKDHLEDDSNQESYRKAREILNSGISLDEINFVIPVFLTYESATVKKFNSASETFKEEIKKELTNHFDSIDTNKNKIPSLSNFKFCFFLLPLSDVENIKQRLEQVREANE